MPETITVTLTRFQEPDWLVWETLESLSHQRDVDISVLYLEQSDDATLRSRIAELNRENVRFICEQIPAVSLSYARNYAVEHAGTDVVLFIDSDAIADADWAANLSRPLLQGRAAISGSRILPKWHRKPLAIAKSRVVSEQYSLLDLGDDEIAATKVVGAGFGIHRKRLGDQAYFATHLGRRAGVLLGGEETDLCQRAIEAGLGVVYAGGAVVNHQILPERIRYRWILRRIYYAGISRAMRGGSPDPSHGGMTVWDLSALPLVLPVYALGYLMGRRQRADEQPAA